MRKTILVLMMVFGLVASVFATPRLEGNKIYLDEAVTSAFTAEEFIANVGGEEALDIPDSAGNTRRMQLELLCNPNKVIECSSEELAAALIDEIEAVDLQPSDLYVQFTGRCESLDFWLFITLLGKVEYDPRTTPTYIYVEE